MGHPPAPMRFITIRGSHYVERARWALDLAGMSYSEDSSPPIVHIVSTLASRPVGCTTTSVPMLITPDQGTLTDSRDIMAYAAGHPNAAPEARSLYPTDPALLQEVKDLEQKCATRLGAWARVILYQHLLQDSRVTMQALCQGCPAGRCRAFWLFYWPFITLMRKAMRITPANAAVCLNKTRALFQELSQRLEASTTGGGCANSQRYLVGNSFTAADLTFASMAGIILLPEHYGGRPGTVDLSSLKKMFPDEILQELRNTTAGRHALEVYRKHRLPEAVQEESKL